jgi:hypothetical protein
MKDKALRSCGLWTKSRLLLEPIEAAREFERARTNTISRWITILVCQSLGIQKPEEVCKLLQRTLCQDMALSAFKLLGDLNIKAHYSALNISPTWAAPAT